MGQGGVEENMDLPNDQSQMEIDPQKARGGEQERK